MKPIKIINKLNESVTDLRPDVLKDFIKNTKQLIKDPDYFYDNDVLDKAWSESGDDFFKDQTVTPIYSAEEFYDRISYGLELQRTSSKMPQDEVEKNLKVINDLKDYAEKCGNRNAVKGIEKVLNVRFAKFDTYGQLEKENRQRSITYYALYKAYGEWKWITSNGETRKEFKDRLMDDYEIYDKKDLKIFDNKFSFRNACNKVGIRPNLRESVDNSSKISVSKVANFIEQSVKDLTTTGYTNSRFILDDTFAIYVGWSDGYDDKEILDYELYKEDSPTWRINAGVKVRNDADWADYDYLDFPWSPDGEVWDTGVTINKNEDYNSIAEYLISQYEEIKKEYSSGKLKID